MNPTFTGIQNQTQSSEQLSTLNKYFVTFKVGTILNRAGITKIKGATPLTIFTALFNLAFCNTNLSIPSPFLIYVLAWKKFLLSVFPSYVKRQ